jgi:hypothetical protein
MPSLLFVVLGAAFLSSHVVAQEPVAVHRAAGFDISVVGDLQSFTMTTDVRRIADGVDVLALTIRSSQPARRRASR